MLYNGRRPDIKDGIGFQQGDNVKLNAPKRLYNFVKGKAPMAQDNEGYCRRFDPGGSLDRRVNCRRVPQPRWVGARRSTEGGNKETGVKGKPAAFVFVPRPGRVRLQ